MKKSLSALLIALALAAPTIRPHPAHAFDVALAMGAIGVSAGAWLYGEQYVINTTREEQRMARIPVTGYMKPPTLGHASTPLWSYPPGYGAAGYDPRHANPTRAVPTVVYSSVQATRAGQPVYSMHPRDRALLQEALRQSDEAREEARAARRQAGLGHGLGVFVPQTR